MKKATFIILVVISLFIISYAYVLSLSMFDGPKNVYTTILLRVVDDSLSHRTLDGCPQKSPSELRGCVNLRSVSAQRTCPNWWSNPNCAIVSIDRSKISEMVISDIAEFSAHPCKKIPQINIPDALKTRYLTSVGCGGEVGDIYWIVVFGDEDRLILITTDTSKRG